MNVDRSGLAVLPTMSVLTTWQQILTTAIESLSPLHRDIVMYVLSVPGKRKPAYSYAKATWNWNRDEFDLELGYAFLFIRQKPEVARHCQFFRFGLHLDAENPVYAELPPAEDTSMIPDMRI